MCISVAKIVGLLHLNLVTSLSHDGTAPSAACISLEVDYYLLQTKLHAVNVTLDWVYEYTELKSDFLWTRFFGNLVT